MDVERAALLVKVAETRTDRAAEELARTRSGLHEQELRLAELRRYLHEYRSRPLPHSPVLIANRERFIARLGEAELQQLRAVEQATRAVQESTQQWMLQRQGQSKFDTLHEGALRAEAQRSERHQQSQLDEFALRRFAVAGRGDSGDMGA